MKPIQSDRKEQLPADAFAPYAGYDGTTQRVLMNPQLSPSVQNVVFPDGVAQTRYGYGKLMARWQIGAVNTGSKRFTISSSLLDDFLEVDQSIVVNGSTGNDGTYTITSVTESGGDTLIVVDEAVSDSTADGEIIPLFKGDCMVMKEFTESGGTKYLLALTTKRQYQWDGTNNAWLDKSPRWSINTATLGVAGLGEFTISGDVTSELKAGQTFVVEGSTGNDRVYTLASVTWDDPLTDIVPDQAVATSDNDGELVHEFTGDEDDMIDFSEGVDDNGTRIMITNNINAPLYYNGSGDFTIAIAGGNLTFTSFVKCKTLCELHGYMWYGNVETTATDRKLANWSKNNDFLDCVTGASGSNLFTDGEGELIRLMRLGDFIVVYFNNSIHLVSHVGGTALFKFDKHAKGIGPVSPRAIADVGPFHIFMGEEDFYLYDGTMLVRSIGDKSIAKPLRENFNNEYALRAHAFVDPKLSHAYFIVPTGETTKICYMVDYSLHDINDFKWTVLNYANSPYGLGWFSRHDTLTWTGLQILRGDSYTWSVAYLDYTWDDTQVRKNYPTKVFGSGQYAYIYEPSMTDDDGTAIDSWKDSIAFTVPQDFRSLNGRWFEIEVDLKGTTCDVQYSTDEGKTWTYAAVESDGSDADGISLTSEWTSYKFFVDVVSQTLSVRLRSPDLGSSFFSRWLRVWVRPGEPS